MHGVKFALLTFYCVLKIRLICKSRCRRWMAISRWTVIIKFGNLCSCFYGLWLTLTVWVARFCIWGSFACKACVPCYRFILNSSQPNDEASNQANILNFRVASLAIWREPLLLTASLDKSLFALKIVFKLINFDTIKPKGKIINWPFLSGFEF